MNENESGKSQLPVPIEGDLPVEGEDKQAREDRILPHIPAPGDGIASRLEKRARQLEEEQSKEKGEEGEEAVVKKPEPSLPSEPVEEEKAPSSQERLLHQKKGGKNP
ncbi:hypothetical protein ISS85_02310 [Candidatus Microgenomates bacterium]|nr:hypothetical protein [Candidatus Microgenomates bacterium]